MSERTAIFAHRGFSAAYPENTMSAFVAAERLGVDGIELDIQLTKDGQFVVIHDSRLERTTSGFGNVVDFTTSQLKQLSAGAWFSPYFQNESIPLFEEVLDWARGNHLKIIVEIKTTAEKKGIILERIHKMMDTCPISERIILSSFDHELIYQLSQKLPQVETAIISLGTLYKPEEYLQSLGIKSWHYHFPMLTEEVVKRLLEKDFKLRAFGISEPKNLDRAYSYSVTAIMTQNSDMAIDLINNKNTLRTSS